MPNTLISLRTNSDSDFYEALTTRLEANGYRSIMLSHRDPGERNHTNWFTFGFTLTTDIVEDSKRLALVCEIVEKDPNTVVFVEGLWLNDIVVGFPIVEYLSLLKGIPCDVFVLDLEHSDFLKTSGHVISYDRNVVHTLNRYATLMPRSPITVDHNVEDSDFGSMPLADWCKAYVRNKKINEII